MTTPSAPTRRDILATSAAFGASSLLLAGHSAAATGTGVGAFEISVPDLLLADLKARIRATRWAGKETVPDASQGVQSANLQEIARYWDAEYDWRKVEATLNALPQFMTTIDGLDIHFIHVRSRHANALPVVITHGWPGSVIEQLKIIGPLTDPTAHGGTAQDAFDVVIPSLPGYGFSGKPAAPGWNPLRVATAWDTLMNRLGYGRYVAQGGDFGAIITDVMARLGLPALKGIHLNFFFQVPPDVAQALATGGPAPAGLTETERADFDRRRAFNQTGQAYLIMMSTHPQTIGHSLADLPAGLAAWMLDHDKRSYERISELFSSQRPYGAITRDDVLDNVTLYWLTDTGASSGRLYWEGAKALAASKGAPLPSVTIPVAVSVFPDEIWGAPRTWVEQAYKNLVHYNQLDRGGHFAAWEEPELFAAELRSAFRTLRGPA